MHNEFEMGTPQHAKRYTIGLIGSLILTMASYFTVSNHWLSGKQLLLGIGALAIAQTIVQLVFFLHLGEEPKPRWGLLHFVYMVLMVIILVGGTLWIMYHLDYRVMPMETHL